MRYLLRVLAPLLGLALAAAGILLVIEVVAAWLRPTAEAGLTVPWPDWQATMDELTWADFPVAAVAIGVAVVGLLLALVGLLARRSDIVLDSPTPAMAVTTSPRVLARIVGRRVRETDEVASASVTASPRRIVVTARSWAGAGPELRSTVREQVDDLLTELPLHRRPRVSVSVQERKGPR
ncbi:MAG: DUF6286 domain-containing protein [Pseudonocardia sp.]|nr:DUF6286 domain-containing protein [Pseudonocardia sp.]